MEARPLVIGVGNRDRGDDAVGPAVADAVADRCGDAVESIVVDGDLVDLALRWGDERTVVVVDAMVGGGAPGTVVELDGLTDRFDQDHPVSSHGVGLGAAIELARALDRLPRSLTVLAVEGARFELLASLSEPVAGAVTSLTDRIERLVTGSGENDDGGLDRPVDH